MFDVTAIVGGFMVGTIVGLTGVGGGSLMTPLLLSVFGLSPAAAIGTDLWFAALTKAGGSWQHHLLGHVDWRITRRLLAGSLPAACATVAWLHLGGSSPNWHPALAPALGLALLLTALAVFFQAQWARLGQRLHSRWFASGLLWATIGAGAVLGVLVTLTSVGAGALGSALLVLLYPRLNTQSLVGTDIAHAVPLTLVAAIGHASLGHVMWGLLAWLLVGSLPGIALGAHLARRLPAAWVRAALGTSLTAAAVKVWA